jgi:hypothetical protein
VLPSLLLADDEALAIAISLRSAAAGTVAGLEEPALQAPWRSSKRSCPRGGDTA